MYLSPSVCRRLLLICPHPDDETLGAGLLLQDAVARGSRIRVVYLTDGDRNSIAQFLYDESWPFRRADRERFAAVRRGEALQALRSLGVPPSAAEFWHLPDQKLSASAAVAEDRMSRLLAEWRPTIVIAPSPRDLHSDHVAAAWLTRRAIDRCGAPPLHLTYRVHGEVTVDGTALVSPAGAERQSIKMRAMAAHATQLVAARTRMLQLAARDEIFRRWSDEAALPPVRLRPVQRLLHLMPASASPAVEEPPEPLAALPRHS